MSERIEVKAYAKINLCLDVPGLLPNGYHEVNMVMQQILLHDDVAIRWTEGSGEDGTASGAANGTFSEAASGAANGTASGVANGTADGAAGGVRIVIHTNRRYLPTDQRNLAWQAAEEMIRQFGAGRTGELRIDMKKRIPVAAGLAGGSSNCAAVIHGINQLWELGLSLEELCEVGARLGSDVPFCVMGQAAEDPQLKPGFAGDALACHCAVATGRGTDLRPVKGLVADLVLSKPAISVSTAEAYRGVDEAEIPERPDVEEMVEALRLANRQIVEKNMINVLENFTLKQYPIVVYTKDKMQEMCNHGKVLMSGSGPTVYGLCASRDEAKKICDKMKEINRESYWTRTTR